MIATPESSFPLTPRTTAVFLSTDNEFSFDPLRLHVGSVGGVFGDADGDGDVDSIGRSLVESRRFDTVADGVIQQFEPGVAGTGGVVPVLGATGPLRPDSTTASIRLRRAVGGAPVFIFHSPNFLVQPDTPFPGTTLFLAPPFTIDVTAVSGAAGQAGAGEFDAPLQPSFLTNAAGQTLYFQAAVLDLASPSLFSVTNGLRLTLGL